MLRTDFSFTVQNSKLRFHTHCLASGRHSWVWAQFKQQKRIRFSLSIPLPWIPISRNFTLKDFVLCAPTHCHWDGTSILYLTYFDRDELPWQSHNCRSHSLCCLGHIFPFVLTVICILDDDVICVVVYSGIFPLPRPSPQLGTNFYI